ncbi:hypothetical protein B1690_12820 [Geobacillus sp. 46C-IIa]|nr:hypothetical protein B1690_12820 [Geobacillus sp. 46C-IIa]
MQVRTNWIAEKNQNKREERTFEFVKQAGDAAVLSKTNLAAQLGALSLLTAQEISKRQRNIDSH